jgi:hypothetical protein
MANSQTISQAIKEIKAAYPRFVIEDKTVKIWAVYLADLPDDLLMTAVRKFISSSSHAFPPSIPEIRHTATQIRAEIQGMPSPYEAWDDLLRAGNGWAYETGENPDGSTWFERHEYQFRHPLVQEVARRLGWPGRFPDGENDVADRAHFFKAYENAASKISRTETQLPVVSAYIANERELLLEDRRAALNTGEQAEINEQYRLLSRKMEK